MRNRCTRTSDHSTDTSYICQHRKDVVIIGNGEKAEIWNKEAWDEINNEESLNMDEIADKLDELDFRI